MAARKTKKPNCR